MEDEWIKAQALLGTRTKAFPKERGADARELASQQVDLWKAFLDELLMALVGGPIPSSNELVAALRQSICQPKNFVARPLADTWVTEGVFPLLHPNARYFGGDHEEAVRLLAAILVESWEGLLRYSANSENELGPALTRAYNPILTVSMVSYQSAKARAAESEALSSTLKPIISDFQNQSIEAVTLVQHLKNIREAAEQDLRNFENQSSEMVTRGESASLRFLEDTKKDFEALKESVLGRRLISAQPDANRDEL